MPATPVGVIDPEAVEGFNPTLGRDYIVPPQKNADGTNMNGTKYMTGFDILALEAANHKPAEQPDWNWNPQK